MPSPNEREPSQKIFTLEQANAMLPLVGAIVKDLADLSRDVIDRRERLLTLRDNQPSSKKDIYQQELQQIEEELEADSKRLRDYVLELQSLGVEPKNGPEGIVDFPCLIHDHVALLCWKLGETEITHWHEIDAGFAGRQELPSELTERRPEIHS